jgi:hypothetical protein
VIVAALVVLAAGVETRDRALEEVTIAPPLAAKESA